MKLIKFQIQDYVWLEWDREAHRIGVPVGTWARMKMLQTFPVALPTMPGARPTAPVQETTQERKGKPERPANGWLRERITAEVGDRPVHKRDIPALAKKLGEQPRAVMGSLQSMANSKRATFDKTTGIYQIVKEG